MEDHIAVKGTLINKNKAHSNEKTLDFERVALDQGFERSFPVDNYSAIDAPTRGKTPKRIADGPSHPAQTSIKEEALQPANEQ